MNTKPLLVTLSQRVYLEAIDDQGRPLPRAQTRPAIVVEIFPDGCFRTENPNGGSSKDWCPDGYRYLVSGSTKTPTGGWRVKPPQAIAPGTRLIQPLDRHVGTVVTFRKNDLLGVWTVFGPASEIHLGALQAKSFDGQVRTVNVIAVVRNTRLFHGVPYTYGLLARPKAAPKQCRKCGTLAFSECFDWHTHQSGYACHDCLSAFQPV